MKEFSSDAHPECKTAVPALSAPDDRVITLQPGLMVCHTVASDFPVQDDAHSFPGDSEFLHFNCQLAGHFESRVGSHCLAYSKGEVTLGFSAGECFNDVRHCEQFQNLTVMVKPDTLYELAGEEVATRLGIDASPDFFVRCAGMCRKTMRSGTHLACLLNERPCQRLLLYAATLDYLHWHLSAFEVCESCKVLAPRERRQLESARTLLLEDLSTPPTIAALARAVGMNQCKLKAGFKMLFGSSIYALFQEERMNRAKQLLAGHNVTETAVMLGYSNISHFSAAYRKQFGHLPSQTRQYHLGGVDVQPLLA